MSRSLDRLLSSRLMSYAWKGGFPNVRLRKPPHDWQLPRPSKWTPRSITCRLPIGDFQVCQESQRLSTSWLLHESFEDNLGFIRPPCDDYWPIDEQISMSSVVMTPVLEPGLEAGVQVPISFAYNSLRTFVTSMHQR